MKFNPCYEIEFIRGFRLMKESVCLAALYYHYDGLQIACVIWELSAHRSPIIQAIRKASYRNTAQETFLGP